MALMPVVWRLGLFHVQYLRMYLGYVLDWSFKTTMQSLQEGSLLQKVHSRRQTTTQGHSMIRSGKMQTVLLVIYTISWGS